MSCLPPDLQLQADRAQRRKDAALDRLLRRVCGALPAGDDVERALRALIDADKACLDSLQRKSP
jgi:hypothetical protein